MDLERILSTARLAKAANGLTAMEFAALAQCPNLAFIVDGTERPVPRRPGQKLCRLHRATTGC